jgi:hypothetical protein
MCCDKTLVLLKEQNDCVELYISYGIVVEYLKRITGGLAKEQEKQAKKEIKENIIGIERGVQKLGYTFIAEELVAMASIICKLENGEITFEDIKKLESISQVLESHIKGLNKEIKEIKE